MKIRIDEHGQQSPAGTRLKAVLVDDVPDVRLLVRVTLEASGRFVVVGEASDGRAAVELAGHHRPDVLLLDVSMPVEDGIEALPKIRVASPHTRVVMLSSFEAGRLEALALERGAAAYLEKGLPAEALVAAIIDACRPAAA